MAITIEQQAYTEQQIASVQNDVQPVYTPAVFVVSSTNVSNINFRYVADVYINGTNVTRLKFSPNATLKGIVDVTDILKDHCESQVNGFNNNGIASGSAAKSNISSIHRPMSIHQIDEFSRNDNVMIDWQVYFGEEYQLTQDSAPQIYDGKGEVGEPDKQSNHFQAWNSTFGQYVDLMNKQYTDYIFGNASKKVLSVLEPTINRKIRRNDYHTIAVFNGTNRDNLQSRVDRMNVRAYSETGFEIAFFQKLNVNSTGGNAYYNVVDDSESNFLFVGVGTRNFANSGQAINILAKYYTVQFVSGGQGKSNVYRFDIVDCDEDNEIFKTYRLGWLNSLGGYDYYNFTMKNETSFDIERQTYMQTVGTWQSDTYFFQEGDFGRSDFNVDARQKLKLQTDWLVDGEVQMLKECFMSPRVWLIEQGSEGDRVFPVNVQSTNFIEYRQKDDKVFQYELEVSFSHKHRIQNG